MIQTWFQARRQSLLVGIVFLLGLPLTTPLWQWTQAACTHDGHLHYHRVAAMRHAWENGLYFSRWLPDLAFGYGYPFFLYREPVPLYLTLFPHLGGLPLSAAGNLFYILCILLGGVFTFLWVRDIFGERSGIISAFAYMSAPYVLIDALIRGNQPETIALMLFPFLLWSGRRAMLSNKKRWFITIVLGLALFSLSHNISLLLFTPFLFIYMALVGFSDDRYSGNRSSALPTENRSPDHRSSAILKLALIFTLGLGITAFYPGSALLEMGEVTLSLSTTTRNNDFRFNFAPLSEIFAPISTADPNLLNPPLPFRLGWIPTGLALLGTLIGLRRGNREQRIHIIFLLGSALFFIFMSTRASFWLWENLPLIDFVQFPWRFVGRAALPVAVLAGVVLADDRYSGDRWSEKRSDHRSPEYRSSTALSSVILFSAILLLFLETTPNLYPRLCDEESFPEIGDVFLYEHVTGLVGVDPEGSYFPRTVLQRPSGSALEGDYATGQPPRRVDQTSFPAGATLQTVEYANNHTTFTLETAEPFRIRYLTFAFPGWQASINGERTEIIPTDPEGLISFDIPAGTHQIEVFFGWTPLRLTLAIASLLALVAFVASIPYYPRYFPITDNPVTDDRHPSIRPSVILLLIPLAFGLYAVKLTLLDPALTPLRRPATPSLPAAESIIGAELELIAKRLPTQPVPADQVIEIDLGWRANSVPSERYQTALTLVGPDGLRWSEKELYRPRIYEDMPDTVYWFPGQWGWDSWEIEPFAGIPAGSYDVEMTLFDRTTLQPVMLLNGEREALGTAAIIGNVTITPPLIQPKVTPQYAFDTPIDSLGLQLVGYALDRELVDPREKMLVTFYFEKVSQSQLSTFDINFTDQAGNQTSIPIDLADQQYGLFEMPIGTTFRSQHFIEVPGDVDVEQYQLDIRVEESINLRPIFVRQFDRQFDTPAFEQPVDLIWADQVRLAGYTLLAEEDATTVTLIWQGLDKIDTSYRVFVHGVDIDGNIVTQSDGEPANWERPTTGWAENEYIVDFHPLLTKGIQPIDQIIVGLYDPQTGQRLLQSNDQETLVIRLN